MYKKKQQKLQINKNIWHNKKRNEKKNQKNS